MDRVPCCVPGCRRSFRAAPVSDEDAEIMCRRCMRLADGRLQRAYKRLRRRIRLLDRRDRFNPLSERGLRTLRVACGLDDRIWSAIKADAQIRLALGAEAAPRRQKRAAA